MEKNSLKNEPERCGGISRRTFLGGSAALVGGTLLSPLPVSASAYVAGSDTLDIALIGCGARGAGAARDAIGTDGPVRLVAMADVFRDKIESCYENLMGSGPLRDHIQVPEEHKFTGLNGYKDAIELADVVILATPPAFRPFHFEAAIEAGKHVFMEKPLASDSPGIRKLLAAGRQADEKGLSVVVGLQSRYANRENELVRRIHSGEIGVVTSIRCQYMVSDITIIPRQEGQTELEYQLRNWRHFCWLWAGSPAALTIHMSDVANWVKGSYPVRAFGTGGRAVFEGPERGDIYDHFYIEYEYADGTRLHSTTRHVPGGWFNRGCYFQGTEGRTNHHASRGEADIQNLNGEAVWRYQADNDPNPFQVEHDVLFAAIRDGNPVNDTEWGAYSSLTEIMGRMAVHSGHSIEWQEALNSNVVLVPGELSLDSPPPVRPGPDGHYRIPVPGSKSGIV